MNSEIAGKFVADAVEEADNRNLIYVACKFWDELRGLSNLFDESVAIVSG